MPPGRYPAGGVHFTAGRKPQRKKSKHLLEFLGSDGLLYILALCITGYACRKLYLFKATGAQLYSGLSQPAIKDLPAQAEAMTAATTGAQPLDDSLLIVPDTAYSTTTENGERITKLVSRDGRFEFSLQADGRVSLDKQGKVLWQTKPPVTKEKGKFNLFLLAAGNLVVFDSARNPVWKSHSGDPTRAWCKLMAMWCCTIKTINQHGGQAQQTIDEVPA